MRKYSPVLFFCYFLIFVAGCASKPAVVEEPLIELIQPHTTPQMAASLRLTQEGKTYLSAGDLTKASEAFERAIAIAPSNPYAYYFFARLHFEKNKYKQSLGLLAKAEMLFKDNSEWLSNVYSLMGRNMESLSLYADAEKRYTQALKLNNENTEAKEGLERIPK